MDKDFRYYFQHPWSRLVVAYLVIFFNFLIFAEDPVSHSQTEANVIVVGNCFSFVTNKYPEGGGWRFLKVFLWLLAILTGLIAGKFLFHQRLFGQLLRLKMFREDHGSWMTMFFSTILFLFIFSHIYNLFLIMAGNMSAYIITDFMGIRNENFMKVAAVGTWMGDFVTAWMVTDMMLQDKPYPDWGKSARAFWKKGNIRIILFWTVLFTLTSVVVLVITTDWISWDKLNRGFLPSDEVSRAFLASFILVFDLLIVMQDWEFPHFMGDVEVNLPGLPSAHMQFKVPYFQKILKDEYHIHITDSLGKSIHLTAHHVSCLLSACFISVLHHPLGDLINSHNTWHKNLPLGKWFNYGIIFLVLILDLNMWKNQIFYKPHEYGQYIGPGQKIYTVKDSESLKDLNRTKLSWEWRSNNTNPLTNRTYAEGDMFLHSRFTGSSLDVKCLAFIPSLLAFALFGFFIWFFGRFQKTDQGMENLDKSYTRMKRKSPSDMGMTRENTQVLEEPLNFQEPHLVSIKSDLSEIVFNSSLLTSENLNAQLNEQDSPLQPVPESSVPKNNPVT
ncbi:transmembrane protein 117-like isoform X1 [Poecile atricapillus]|uniref:transmembrane protein 117-like isoform X1 n=1 Tax=Poecile atricapillus TaxID=48891 RepID=UPI0027382693|nr:transmembrane protein 117-like isoform X1 [Poecile atricapillus]XP_058718868.1 transmembrane protein 117-like isoform X1 [Poecile atricapillus]XP_058718869.1 transmembrane protein 117-like isoform X1 [Poecile atricapillus]